MYQFYKNYQRIIKGKVLPYSLPSIGPRADPSVQAVSRPQATLSHPPGGRLPLLSARPAVTSVAFHQTVTTVYTVSTHPILAHYSFIDPKRMKG